MKIYHPRLANVNNLTMLNSTDYETVVSFELENSSTIETNHVVNEESALFPNLIRGSRNIRKWCIKHNVARSTIVCLVLFAAVIVLSSIISTRKPQVNNPDKSDQGVLCINGNCLSQRCSENGVFDAFLQKCICSECFSGETCLVDDSASPEHCDVVDVTVGDPMLFENYWVDPATNLENSITINPAWGMHYKAHSVEKTLTDNIRALHRLAYNMNVSETDSIVIGVGSTHLLSGALFAIAKYIKSSKNQTADVYAEVPYYDAYSTITSFYESNILGSFNPDISSGNVDIEIITSPNNPSGEMRSARLKNSIKIYDRAYYWPHYHSMNLRIVEDSDISLHTLSKLSGHAGSRIGWAIVRNPDIAQLMRKFIDVTVSQVPHESVWRAHVILSKIVDSQGEIFQYGRKIMEDRWSKLHELFNVIQHDHRFSYFPNCSRISNAFVSCPESYCNFFKRYTTPSAPYLWIQCNAETDLQYISRRDHNKRGCHGLFYDVGISGQSGRLYGEEDDRYVRIELLMNERTFQVLYKKLVELLMVSSQPS